MGCTNSKGQKNAVAQVIEKNAEKSENVTNVVNIEKPGDQLESKHIEVPENKKTEIGNSLQNLKESAVNPSITNSKVLSHKEGSFRRGLSTKINLTAPPEDACCYFFGIDSENAKKIFKYNPKKEGFSQLEVPANLEVFNMSACVYISETCIYLTGGTDSQATKISNKAFVYNPTQNTAEALPPFSVERYAHQAVFFEGQLYVIGGLGSDKPVTEANEDQENVLKSVERYDTKSKTWESLGNLNYRRSLALAIVYQSWLYVLGGYVGHTKRTRTIERLDPQTKNWEIIYFKLPCSLEASFVFCPGPDQIQILGGQDVSGPVDKNYVYYLKEDNYVSRSSMNHERVLHKGFLYKDKIIVFGGDTDDTVEEYHVAADEWIKQPSADRLILNESKLFSYSSPTLLVPHQSEAVVEEDSSPVDKKSKKCFIFGDDEINFILEVNFTKNFVKERTIPSNLKLFGYQGIAALNNGTYLLCGGINKASDNISAKCYIYNPMNNTARKIQKCHKPRYTFNLIVMGEYVYALGGRTWGEDNQAILNSCERYNILTNTWEEIASLKYPRCSAMAFHLKNRIYMLGGYKGESERWAGIEIYYPEKNVWDSWKIELKVALEGSSLVMANRRGGIFLLGGRTDDGDTDKIWDFDVEQGDMWEVGNLKEPKSLNKVFEFQERKAFILGGEKYMTEFFDLTESKVIQETEFSNQINESLKYMLQRGKPNNTKIIRFGLA